MEVEWDWQGSAKNIKKKEGKKYELWRIWWTICATRTNKKVK